MILEKLVKTGSDPGRLILTRTDSIARPGESPGRSCRESGVEGRGRAMCVSTRRRETCTGSRDGALEDLFEKGET